MDVGAVVGGSFRFIFDSLGFELARDFPKIIVALIPMTTLVVVWNAVIDAWTSFKEAWDMDLLEPHEPDGHKVTRDIADELDLEALADLLRSEFFNSEQAEEIGLRNPEIYEQQEIEGFDLVDLDGAEIFGQTSLYGNQTDGYQWRGGFGPEEDGGNGDEQLAFLE